MKLRDTLLLAAALGCFILWILEFRRSSFADSYWLLLCSLSLLFVFQYLRIRQREATKTLSPTVRQMAEDRLQKAQSEGRTPADAVKPKPPVSGKIRPSASGKKKKQ